jgi:hypothetical protein
MTRRPPLDLHVLTRVNYFPGQLLTVDDFRTEQEYQRDRVRLHNRLLHGIGVVAGLEVRTSGGQVIVSPGMALDPSGDEIVLAQEGTVALPAAADRKARLYVLARLAEVPTAPVVALGATDDATECSRIELGAALSIESAQPAPPNVGVVLARLQWRAARWRVDPRYRRAKAK